MVILPCAQEVVYSFRRPPASSNFWAWAAAHAQKIHGMAVAEEMAAGIAKKISG